MNTNEEIFFTDGDWRIARFTYTLGSYLSIQHYCTAGRSDNLAKGWVGMYYHYRGLKETCYICNRLPPDELQGMFIMLMWDKTS